MTIIARVLCAGIVLDYKAQSVDVLWMPFEQRFVPSHAIPMSSNSIHHVLVAFVYILGKKRGWM